MNVKMKIAGHVFKVNTKSLANIGFLCRPIRHFISVTNIILLKSISYLDVYD